MNLYCPKCGYDLRGIPERRCPECGFGYDHAAIQAIADDQTCETLAAYRRAVFASAFATVFAIAFMTPRSLLGYVAWCILVFVLLSITEIVRRVTGGERLGDCFELSISGILEGPFLMAVASFALVVFPVAPLGAIVAVTYGWLKYISRPSDLPFSLLCQPEALRYRVATYRTAARIGLPVSTFVVLVGWQH